MEKTRGARAPAHNYAAHDIGEDREMVTRFYIIDRCRCGDSEKVGVYIEGEVTGIREGDELEIEEMLVKREGRKVYIDTGDTSRVEWR